LGHGRLGFAFIGRGFGFRLKCEARQSSFAGVWSAGAHAEAQYREYDYDLKQQGDGKANATPPYVLTAPICLF
jgi:hypothetical protein